MQCPNCHKEAINVNGKYVCLDCGVEIAAEEETVQEQPVIINRPAPDSTSPIANSSSAQSMITPQENPVDLSQSTPSVPPTVPVPEPSLTPIKDEVKAEIEQANDVPTEIPVSAETPNEEGPQAVVPDFPSSVVGTSKDKELSPTPTEESGSSDLNIDNTASATPTTSEPTAVSQNPLQVENYFQPQEMNINPSAVQQETENTGSPNFDALSIPSGIGAGGEPMVDNLADSQPPHPSQPSTVTPNFPETSNADVATQQPVIDQSQPAETTSINQSQVQPQSETNAVPASQNLDDLLNAYSTPQTNIFSPAPSAVNQEQASGVIDPLDNVLPNTNSSQNVPTEIPPANVPAFDSVFGATPKANPTPQSMSSTIKQNLFANKKMFLIVGGAVLGLFVIIGIIFGVASLRSKTPDANTQELVNQELSAKVQGAMEGEINAEVSFSQTIDFSKITLKEAEQSESQKIEALKVLIKNQSANKGKWKVNSSGDVELDSVVNNVADKEIYVKSDESTYVYNGSTSAWDKKDGFLINSIPGFYSAESRGKLFYMAQADGFENVGPDDLNGTTYTKYQVKSNSEFIQSAISKSNPILASIAFESLNVSNLKVYAWVDEEGRVHKVSVDGNVEASADLFSGMIVIKSEANYEYKDDLEIKSPVVQTNSTPVADSSSAANNQKDIEIRATKASVVKTSEKIEGRG